MNQEQIRLVRKSWKVFLDIDREIVGDLFYTKLFADSPNFKKIFTGDMRRHYSELSDLITLMVINLDRQDKLSEEILTISKRLAGYEVKPVHLKLFSDTLLWTLKKGMGKSWDKETQNAWVVTCTWISSLMMDVLSPVQAQ